MQFEKAVKKGLKVKIALIGPSGSGKTYSALRLATGMGGKTLMVETEAGRGLYYADEFDYDYTEITPPYTPEKYIAIVNEAISQKYDNIIIDSITHEWAGKGGILEQHSLMTGNSYTNWAKLTPRHNLFVDTLTKTNINLIATIRGKDEYLITENEKGKQAPKKVGVGAITRDGFEYEVTTSFLLSTENHIAEIMKDNTKMFTYCELLTEEHGKRFIEWANSGVKVDVDKMKTKESKEPVKSQLISQQEYIGLLKIVNEKKLDISELLKKQKWESLAECPENRLEELKKHLESL